MEAAVCSVDHTDGKQWKDACDREFWILYPYYSDLTGGSTSAEKTLSHTTNNTPGPEE